MYTTASQNEVSYSCKWVHESYIIANWYLFDENRYLPILFTKSYYCIFA